MPFACCRRSVYSCFVVCPVLLMHAIHCIRPLLSSDSLVVHMCISVIFCSCSSVVFSILFCCSVHLCSRLLFVFCFLHQAGDCPWRPLAFVFRASHLVHCCRPSGSGVRGSTFPLSCLLRGVFWRERPPAPLWADLLASTPPASL